MRLATPIDSLVEDYKSIYNGELHTVSLGKKNKKITGGDTDVTFEAVKFFGEKFEDVSSDIVCHVS